MTNWLTETPLRPPPAETAGARFAPRRIDNSVRSRRVAAPSTPIYHSRRHIKIQRGIPVHSVPAVIVRDHINTLTGYGCNYSMIAAAAGTSTSGIQKIATGPAVYVQRTTADAILAVTPTPHPLQRYVLAIGAIRRLRALQAIGWTMQAVADHAGEKRTTIANLGHHPTITYARWKQVADVYDQLSGQLGTNDRTRNWAKKRCWPTPLAWEGVNIDHPDSTPILDAEPAQDTLDEVLLRRILDDRHTGPVPKRERREVLNLTVKNGWTHTRLARLLNISDDAADQALVRHRRKYAKGAA
ncbi:hypothetical protein ACFWU5_16835 [Nocardia sp. NPDC058640]|uniref:hypothetical protein n=1 Tax=Nocardia sp. NPDC058640 TaxID=3346571 RepID=UPI00365E28E7